MADFTEISRLSRLTAILSAIQTGKSYTAGKLAEKHQVSKRTIYRDIKTLTDAGVPIYADETKGYQLVQGYNLPPIMFSEAEASALIIAEKIIARNKDKSLVEAHNSAIEKIKAVMQFSKKETANMLSHRVANVKNLRQVATSNSLLEIQAAITRSKLIKLDYNSLSKAETTSRIIEPYLHIIAKTIG